MKILKKIINNWPVILTLLIAIWCIACILGGALEKDDFFVGAFFFYILFPFCAFFSGLWYGIKIKSKKKWLIVLSFGVIQMILVAFPFGHLGFDFIISELLFGLQVMIPAAGGILIGGYISNYKDKKKRTFNIVEKIVLNILNIIVICLVAIALVFGSIYITSIIYTGYDKIEESITK